MRALGIGRGIALFWALVFALDLAAWWLSPHFDGLTWWVDLRGVKPYLAHASLVASVVMLTLWATRGEPSRARAWATGFALGGIYIAIIHDAAQFYVLRYLGSITSPCPVPVSLVTLGMLFAMVVFPPRERGRVTGAVLGFALCLVVMPLAQMCGFGLTDYRRPAHVAVVFGARAYASGTPSPALAQRIDTAIELYRAGLVRKLVFSGGPGDGAVSEPQAMRGEAIRRGVPPADILLDEQGLNTRATVANTTPLLRELGGKVLAVSHFYHLPRVKMCYQAAGLEVYTVPARMDPWLRQLPWLMAREVPALWMYYLRALVGEPDPPSPVPPTVDLPRAPAPGPVAVPPDLWPAVSAPLSSAVLDLAPFLGPRALDDLFSSGTRALPAALRWLTGAESPAVHPAIAPSLAAFLSAYERYVVPVNLELARQPPPPPDAKAGVYNRTRRVIERRHFEKYKKAMAAADAHLSDFARTMGEVARRTPTYLLVQKSAFVTYLVGRDDGLIYAAFPVSIGCRAGPKERRGDLRTPEGGVRQRRVGTTPFFVWPLVPHDPYPPGVITRGIGVDSRAPAHDVLAGGWTIMFHGTPDEDCIGTRSSLGCIRLLPRHIETLYAFVQARSPIVIVP